MKIYHRNLHDALSGHSSNTVAEAVRYSEKSVTKCIGITIETRPDYCLKRHLSDMLSYGCTRLEIGVQSVYEDVARDTNRGHTVRAVCESFTQAKDAGFKVVSHMMPGTVTHKTLQIQVLSTLTSLRDLSSERNINLHRSFKGFFTFTKLGEAM